MDLIDLRCPHCSRLLARMEPDAIREGRVVEWKCGKCERTYTKMGDAEDTEIPGSPFVEARRQAP